MVLQRTDHEANIPFVEQNGVPQADIVFTDTDGREVAIEAKSKKLPIATKRTLDLEAYGKAMAEIFAGLLSLLEKKATV